MDNQTHKIGVLWINFLDGKSLISPILQKYPWNYAASITIDLQNRSEAIREEIERLDVNETSEYKRIVTDRISDSFSVKLHPIDSNLKKVKTVSLFTIWKGISPFTGFTSGFTSGKFDGEA